jgi:hypothetical protein
METAQDRESATVKAKAKEHRKMAVMAPYQPKEKKSNHGRKPLRKNEARCPGHGHHGSWWEHRSLRKVRASVKDVGSSQLLVMTIQPYALN